jgi:hypothetical protein
MPWIAMDVSMLLGVAGNLIYSLLISPMPDEPYPSLADFFYLAYFVPLYVALIGLIRARVPRFHASMWLDGLIGALGAAAVAVAALLEPALRLTEETAAVVTSLAYPTADVVLLALLVAVSAIVGIRRDRTLLLLGAGITANLLGDVIYLDLATQGIYTEGGPLDLTWLVPASRRSTTAWGITPVTSCSARSDPASTPSSARSTTWPASAGTSSPSSSLAPVSTRRRTSPANSASTSSSPSLSKASVCTSA